LELTNRIVIDQNGQLTLNRLSELTGGSELLAAKNFKSVCMCVYVCVRARVHTHKD